ncbi:MAG: DNA primase [Fervidobacterium sp.]|nr:DNA primase [Fervidobacterium sp.]
MIKRQIIELVKEKNDIVEVVSEYVNLQKVGANYRGLCPFHLETSPSFYVSPAKNMYHCFGCGASGDVVKFVQEIENISYTEAVKKLAERAGVDIDIDEEDEKRRLYYSFYKLLHQEYLNSLRKSSNVIEYLYKRGFSEREISLYEFGYSPINSYFPQKVAKSLGISKEDLQAFGFLNTDPFSGRIIIPIKDDYGRIIAFGGRLVGEGVPKYINSQDTMIFKKSWILFLFDQAREYIKNVDYVVICEGYFDALAFHRAGIKNTVATLGTALTRAHILKLKKYTKNILLAFDNDAAGVKATLKSIEMILNEGFNVAIANFREGKDADEIYQKSGSKELIKALEESISPEIFVVERLSRKYDLSNPNGINTFLQSLSNWNRIFSYNPVSTDKFYEAIAKVIHVDKDKLMEMMKLSKEKVGKTRKDYSNQVKNSHAEDRKTKIATTEDYLIYIYYNYPEIFKTINFNPDILDGKAKEFFLIAKDLNVSLEQLSKDMAQFVKEAIERIDMDVDDKVLEYIKKDIEIRSLEKRIGEIDELIKKSKSEDEKKILLKARIELIKQKEKIKRSSL